MASAPRFLACSGENSRERPHSSRTGPHSRVDLTAWLLIAEHTGVLHRYIRRRLLPRTEAVEDVMQETLLAAWQQLPQFAGRAPLRAWLLGIARHKVENHYRAHRRTILPWGDGGERECFLLTPDWDRELDQERIQQRIAATLAKLPEAYRLALQERYWEQRSAAEMAGQRSVTEKAVERLLARARARFRDLWHEPGDAF